MTMKENSNQSWGRPKVNKGHKWFTILICKACVCDELCGEWLEVSSVLTVDRMMSSLVSWAFLADTHPEDSLFWIIPLVHSKATSDGALCCRLRVCYTSRVLLLLALQRSLIMFGDWSLFTVFLVKQSFWQYSSDCGFGPTMVLWFEQFLSVTAARMTESEGHLQHLSNNPLHAQVYVIERKMEAFSKVKVTAATISSS